MKFKLNTAVIGAGVMGGHHCRVYSQISNFRAIADVNQDKGRELASKYHAQFYRDYREMIAKENIDALSIAVPTPLHTDVAIFCLQNKIPIMIEKPIADNIAQAKKIISTARKNNIFIMIGHIERFNSAVIKLKLMLKQHILGEIISLNALRVGMNPPRAMDSDVVLDLAIHDIDIFNFLLDEYPTTQFITRQKVTQLHQSDCASIILKYKKCTGIIQTNWITPIKKRVLYVTGTKGFVELDYVKQKITLYTQPDQASIQNYKQFISLSTPIKIAVYVSMHEPLKLELSHFLKTVRKSSLFQDVSYALHALHIALSKDE